MIDIVKLVGSQREFFNAGSTRDIAYRRAALQSLASGIEKCEGQILAALERDLGKAPFEAWSTEIGVVLGDIRYMLKNLDRLSGSRRVPTPLALMGGSSRILNEPLGVVLIIAPWNYPFHLLMRPLVGALAAGNCAVIKPSEQAAATSAASYDLIRNTFPPEYVTVVEGGADTAAALLEQNFDCIFFTGSPREGSQVMEAAARSLTPVILELGGKSPCIVDHNVDLKLCARRISWGKFLNAGQTCVAPDYILVDRRVKAKLLTELKQSITDFYGRQVQNNLDYARIINEMQFDRLTGLMNAGRIICGGEKDKETRFIAPTLIDQVTWSDPIMQEEIFGPLLPIIEYESLEEAIKMVNAGPKPLALYLFTRDRKIRDKVINETSSGGVCINDTVSHILPDQLPFGGVGSSGIGAYHGDDSFYCFSHRKSVFQNTTLFDLKVKYPPFRLSLKTLKRLMRFM